MKTKPIPQMQINSAQIRDAVRKNADAIIINLSRVSNGFVIQIVDDCRERSVIRVVTEHPPEVAQVVQIIAEQLKAPEVR